MTKEQSKHSSAGSKAPPSESEQDCITYNFGNIEEYEIVERIGRGKYSMVFQGRRSDGKQCVLKILRPVRLAKINREIRILEALRDGPNICHLVDVVRDPESGSITIVNDWINNVDFRLLYQQFNQQDIAFYMYKIVKAIEYAHSLGIMHRDVKPQNIMIDHPNKRLSVIDWGLADYYVPGTAYQVRVATRHYKGPELLLGNSFYDLSIDVWSLGCTFATLLFKRSPFFRGRDNDDLLVKIADTFGSEKLLQYIEANQLPVAQALYTRLTGHAGKQWDHWINDENTAVITTEALDLLSKMLVIDPAQRITTKDALLHPFFDNVRDLIENQS